MNEQTKIYEHPHWPTCWRDPGHQGCAVRKVEHLQVELYKCRAQLRGVQAVLDIERDKWAATHEKLQGRLDVAEGTLAIAVEMEEDLDGQRRVLAERLAAAEAREQALLQWLGDEWRYSGSESQFCALCGAYESDGHERGCPWKELRELDHAALDAYVAERTDELRKELAAAEAREQAVIRLLAYPEWVGGDGQGPDWCPNCRMLKPDGHTDDCVHSILDAWLCDRHAALNAVLEQARHEATARAFDDAAERVCDAEVGVDANWDEETYAAWLNFCQWLDGRIKRELEQARVEGYRKAHSEVVLAFDNRGWDASADMDVADVRDLVDMLCRSIEDDEYANGKAAGAAEERERCARIADGRPFSFA